MPIDSLSSLLDQLFQAQHILLLSHARPDGDALGSLLGTGLWLEEQGHQVTLWNEDPLPQRYAFLPESQRILQPPSCSAQELTTRLSKFDALLILDSATLARLSYRGNLSHAIEKLLEQQEHPPLYAIDHHVSNTKFADYNYIDDTVPATSQIIAEALLEREKKLSLPVATNLFVGINTDTGSFQYHGTNAKTFDLVARLLASGVNVGEVSRQLYHSQPRRRFELLKEVFTQAQFSAGGKIASFLLERSLIKQLGIEREDTEGLIDQLRSIEGVVVALFMEELADGKLKISLRSKDLEWDASHFCARYGGGGHRLAAGAILEGPFQEKKENLLQELERSFS